MVLIGYLNLYRLSCPSLIFFFRVTTSLVSFYLSFRRLSTLFSGHYIIYHIWTYHTVSATLFSQCLFVSCWLEYWLYREYSSLKLSLHCLLFFSKTTEFFKSAVLLTKFDLTISCLRRYCLMVSLYQMESYLLWAEALQLSYLFYSQKKLKLDRMLNCLIFKRILSSSC